MVGVRLSRRWHRPESWAQVKAAQLLAPRFNHVARRFEEADAVLDLSAGDSFTDLYGPTRFTIVTEPKHAALRAGRPLILLPQTYGPFATAAARETAGRIIRRATLAYARDQWSYDRLLELAGPDADPSRLRLGVDVAFALEPRQPTDEVRELLEGRDDSPVVGVNVSGLLTDRAALEQFGIAGDYLETMVLLVRELVAAGAHVVLVPHVHMPGAVGESDIRAISTVRARLSPAERLCTTALPPELDAAEVKWCISGLDWFTGSRMHATIAALSTMTPSTAYAYSDKTRGVFATCGLGEQVVDAREHGGAEAVERLMDGFHAREATRLVLRETAAATIAASRDQFRDVFRAIRPSEASSHEEVGRGGQPC
ncbi:MAG: polysaccharide pyruvyl transferase family protein [Nocardioides sp.]|uniref:polysaccharide pyruvyl transferase family protein n=1 Tax=Nocardioides sp. TaxID=35761 RepID=UPI003F0B1BD1